MVLNTNLSMEKNTPIPGSAGVPQHIAIVMDGNGRWAKKNGKNVAAGHKAGLEAVLTTVEAAGRLGVKYLTLYAFSTENWNRPQFEVRALMELMRFGLKKYTPQLVNQGVRLRWIGSRAGLSDGLVKQMDASQKATERGELMTLIIAFNYGARQEIVDAVKNYSEAIAVGSEHSDQLDWQKLSQFLYTRDFPDPDLFIRTSGESRLSNFLLLQMAYTELVILPVLWPDFGKTYLEEAIQIYNQRDRRFGKREIMDS
jgi:undecaprenyl diphosphate synthase